MFTFSTLLWTLHLVYFTLLEGQRCLNTGILIQQYVKLEFCISWTDFYCMNILFSDLLEIRFWFYERKNCCWYSFKDKSNLMWTHIVLAVIDSIDTVVSNAWLIDGLIEIMSQILSQIMTHVKPTVFEHFYVINLIIRWWRNYLNRSLTQVSVVIYGIISFNKLAVQYRTVGLHYR